MAGQYSSLFEKQAQLYSRVRMSYPDSLYEELYKYCDVENKAGTTVALDVATGTGQAARQLAEKFTKVIAIDSNREQLKYASGSANIEFRFGLAEETGEADQSIDLITVAQALHWFDLPKFYAEAARVLRPGGVLAVWCYTIPYVEGNDLASNLIQELQSGDNALGPYMAGPIRLIEREYVDITPNEADFEMLARQKVYSRMQSSIDQLMGVIESWSAYQTYLRQRTDSPDLLVVFKEKLMKACGAHDGSHVLSLCWPIPLVIARAKSK